LIEVFPFNKGRLRGILKGEEEEEVKKKEEEKIPISPPFAKGEEISP